MLIIKESDPNAIDLACEFLRQGKIISFATDTVYGIAVDASNIKAVEDLYKIKKRDKKKPIAIFVKDLNHAEKIFLFDDLSKKIAEEFLPGALTLVLKTKNEASSFLATNLNCNDDGFLGFRIVDNFFIKKLFEKFDGFLAVSSANISNQDAATTHTEVEKYFDNLDLLICGEVASEKPSTVAKIFNNKITILRNGSVNLGKYENY